MKRGNYKEVKERLRLSPEQPCGVLYIDRVFIVTVTICEVNCIFMFRLSTKVLLVFSKVPRNFTIFNPGLKRCGFITCAYDTDTVCLSVLNL